MKYEHLTQDERYQITILLKAGHKQRDIARIMNRHPSTISRAVRRNRGKRGYRPKQAHEFSQAHVQACENSRRIATDTWAISEARLAELWSPEQISGHLKPNRKHGASHETLYQNIYADRHAGGNLHHALRCQKARQKRYGGRLHPASANPSKCPLDCVSSHTFSFRLFRRNWTQPLFRVMRSASAALAAHHSEFRK